MKRGLIIGGVLLLIAVVAVVLLLANLSSIVKTVVEKVGSAASQAKVTLDKADVSVTSGKGSLHGLTVGNPAGFRTDSAMNFGEIGVDLDVSTVRSDVIVIREIVIGAPKITYEFAAGGSNIETLRKNVQAYAGSEKAKPAATGKTGPKLVIDNLYIRDGQINVSADFLKGQKAGVALPTIHLKDIGKKDGKNMGASAAEVAERVIAAIGSTATRAVGTLNIGAIQDALREGTGGAEKALKEGAEERLKKVLGR
jgi:uncharacterized protein involved in outer membrane biogenesis